MTKITKSKFRAIKSLPEYKIFINDELEYDYNNCILYNIISKHKFKCNKTLLNLLIDSDSIIYENKNYELELKVKVVKNSEINYTRDEDYDYDNNELSIAIGPYYIKLPELVKEYISEIIKSQVQQNEVI